MRKLLFLLLLPLFSAFPQCAQNGTVSFSGTTTTTGQGAGPTLINTASCSTWILNWQSQMAAMTIQIEYSPDGDFWLPFSSSTVLVGSNPSADNTGKIALAGQAPYVRMNVISALGTGTVTYSLDGSGAGGGGSGIGNVSVVGSPISGQTVIATGSTTATWQTIFIPNSQVIGLGSAALASTAAFDPAGFAAAAEAAAKAASDPVGTADIAQANAVALSLQKAANLGDIPSAVTARQNLELGTAATQNVSAFEPPIIAGNASQYWTGQKQWANLNASIWSSLSATAPLVFSNSTGIFSCPTCGVGAVTSVFGQTGTVTAQAGQYTTNLVGESGNLYFTTARAQAALAGLYEVPLTFGAGLNRTSNAITVPALGITNGMLAGSIAAAKLVLSDIVLPSSQVSGLPTFPAGTIVGTTDTQVLTNKTVNGVAAATFAFLDPSSSVQNQLNNKQASLGFTPLNAASNLSDLISPVTARSNLGLGSASTQASTAFEVPLTFSSGLNRTGNTITVPATGIVDSMVASGISPSKVGNSTAQWNANQINGVALSSLATGLLKNTTATGVPSHAASSDVITLFNACTGVLLLAADGNCYAPTGGANQTISHAFSGTQEIAYAHSLNTLTPVVNCFNHASPFAGLVAGSDYKLNFTTPATTSITYITATGITVDCGFNNSGAVGPTGSSGTAPAGTGVVMDNSGVASAVTVSGDGTLSPSTGVLSINKMNGVAMSGLATGIVKNTTTTGVPSIAVAADFPVLNQNTTGNADTASALAANPADCSAGQYATTIAANGNLTCAQVAYSQISGTPTPPTFPSGAIVGTTDTQTLINKTVDGVSTTTFGFLDPTSSVQTQLNSRVQVSGDIGNTATSPRVIGINNVPLCLGFTPANGQSVTYTTAQSPNPCYTTVTAGAALPFGGPGQVILYNSASEGTATTLSGGATVSSSGVVTLGNAPTATALAANPVDCPASQYAQSIAANGNLTCAAIPYTDITGTPALPSGAIVGTTDTQVLTNKTINGAAPSYFAFLDASSSIQGQLNGKQPTLGFTPLAPANNLSELSSASTARTNLGLGSAATQPSSAFEQALSFGAGLNRTINSITIPTGGVTAAMLAGSIPASKLIGSDIAIASTQVTGLPLFPTGPVVGTTDTQSLSNKTLDGVTPLTMTYVDPTSSIQGQLNSKQPTLGFTPLAPANNLSELINQATARTNLGLGTAATQASTAFESPLTFGAGLNRTGNAISVPAASIVDSMVASGISPSKVGNATAQWNANLINGVSLSGLATGILKNTTTTGAPSLAVSADVVSLFNSCTGVLLLAADGNCYAPSGGANQDISHVFTGTQEIAYTHNLNTLTPVIACFRHTAPYAGLVDGTDYKRNLTTSATVNITYITATNLTVDCSFNNSGAVGPAGQSGVAPAGTGVLMDNSGVASAVAITGDGAINPATGVMAVTKINGTALSGLATGILKNTTTTGIPSIAAAADFPVLNQSTTGNATTATALAANPTDCIAGQYATTIAANGNLTCAQVTYGQVSGTPTLPTFPTGTIVGTADTQTITNKSIDGVSNVTMGFVDPTSSIQTQLNSKLSQASNLSDLASATTARTNLGLGTAATQASTSFEVPLTFGPGVSRAVNVVSIPTGGVTAAMLAGIIPFSKLVGSDISLPVTQITGLPAFPTGTIVGTSDSQTLINKTVDGVSPTTLSYVDATSSIQTQLNSKAPAGSACRSTTTFTGQTTITIPGASHLCGTASISVSVYDTTGTLNTLIIPDTVTVNRSTFDVVVGFTGLQTGIVVIQ